MRHTQGPARRIDRLFIFGALPIALILGGATAAQGTQGGNSPNSNANARATSHQASGSAVTPAPTTSPQPLSNADQNGTGANPGTLSGCGAYCSTRDGSASLNGNGTGNAVGKPCAGCVGKADNKNPAGQAPSGPGDANAGYECDRNHGIGRSNPAHTSCTPPPTTTPLTPPTTPPATPLTTGGGGGTTFTGGSGTTFTGGSGTVSTAGGGLPFTGDSTGLLALTALVLLGSGSGLVVAARRR